MVWNSTEIDFEMLKRYGESEYHARGNIGVAAVYATASPLRLVMTKALLGARHF